MNEELESLIATFAFLRGDAPKLRAAIRRALDEQVEKAASVVEELVGHVGDAFGSLGASGDRALEFAAAEIRALKGGGA